MKIFTLPKNIINVQKCLIGDGDFLRRYHGNYCLITVPGTSYSTLAKIGLSIHKQLTGAVSLDDSVSVFNCNSRKKEVITLKEVNFENFMVLPDIISATDINVTVVFSDITYMLRNNLTFRIKNVIKDILKLFVFCVNSVVFLDSLTLQQRNGIHCIIITQVNGLDTYKNFNIFNCTHVTNVIINKFISKEKYDTYQSKKEIKLGGLDKNYSLLREIIEYSMSTYESFRNLKISNNIIITGPSGCGKTSLVHKVVRNYNMVLLEIFIAESYLLPFSETERKIQKIFEKAIIHAKNHEYCVVLIEDIDTLSLKKGSSDPYYAERGVNKLIELLESVQNVRGVIVIGTATNFDDVDIKLKTVKRFDFVLEIEPPTLNERREIIDNILQYFDLKCTEELTCDFALWTPGFVGADLNLAVQETLMLYNKTKGELHDIDCQYLKECFKRVLSNIPPTSLKGSDGLKITKDNDFSKIGGLEEIKKLLDFSVKQQLQNPDSFTRLGIPLTKGILLYGPPGCAKTTLVKALAKESNMTFLAISSADLYSPYVGDPEKKILKLFVQARMGAPSIIFIDEIDGLVGSKTGDRIHGVQERVLSALLIEMDGVGIKTVLPSYTSQKSLDSSHSAPYLKETKNIDQNNIIVIGATNRPERLDVALRRPGRFDKIVYIPPPSEKERLAILKHFTEHIPLNNTVNLEVIAAATNYYSGADLKNLCYESALLSLTHSNMKAEFVDQSHFEHVLSRNRPSLSPEMLNFYESFQRNLC